MHQPLTPAQLLKLEEQGKLPVPLHCYTDCKSLFDTLSVPDLHTPTEASLILIIAMLRELLELNVIQSISWIQTTDMLADGLTKGLVSRKGLLQVSREGTWKIEKEYKTHVPSKPATVQSASFLALSKAVRTVLQEHRSFSEGPVHATDVLGTTLAVLKQ